MLLLAFLTTAEKVRVVCCSDEPIMMSKTQCSCMENNVDINNQVIHTHDKELNNLLLL